MGGKRPGWDDLVRKAVKDLELARRYKDAKELVTASLLYNSAIERVLRALVMARTKKDPPQKASMSYLAMQAKLPAEISEEIISLEDEASDVMEEQLEIETAEEGRMAVMGESEYSRVMGKSNLARRLISYAQAIQ